jgi:hypothetical protein
MYSQAGSQSISSCTPLQVVTDCAPSQFYNFENKRCEFKDLALSCIGKSTDDCISSTYQGTNAAKVSLTDYVYGVEPITFVETKVLPQGLQDTLSTCEGDCKFIAADFTAQTFDKKSDIPYAIDTMQSTAENKTLITSQYADEPIMFNAPPGYAISDYAITVGSSLGGSTSVVGQGACSVVCTTLSDCAGFNLNVGTNTCEFFTSIGSEDYIDSKMSFRKEDIPITQSINTYYPGTNLENQGALCADAVACNSNLHRVIDGTPITSFTTAELQSCEYCPIRKFDRPNYIVTDELGISSNDINNLFFKTNGTISHTQITDGGFYELTPYIPATPVWYQNTFFRKETDSERFKIITGGALTTVGAKSLVPFVPLSDRFSLVYTREVKVEYVSIPAPAGGGARFLAAYNASYTYTVNPPGKFIIIPCDYVEDGFMFHNEQGQFISFNNGEMDAIESPLKYSEEYNKCLFFIKPSTLHALMTQYQPTGEYFSSDQLVTVNPVYNKINFTGTSTTPSYFTDYVTERKWTGRGVDKTHPNGTYVNFQAPVYYSQLATVDPGLVITVSGGGGGYQIGGVVP